MVEKFNNLGKLTKKISDRHEKLVPEVINKMKYLYDIKFKDYDYVFIRKIMKQALDDMYSSEPWTYCYLTTIIKEEHHSKMLEIFEKVLTYFKIKH